MASYEDFREMDRYVAELKGLLAGDDLSPDTRAWVLAALIEAAAADRFQGAVVGFDEHALILASALKGFPESAEQLASGLRRLPER